MPAAVDLFSNPDNIRRRKNQLKNLGAVERDEKNLVDKKIWLKVIQIQLRLLKGNELIWRNMTYEMRGAQVDKIYYD